MGVGLYEMSAIKKVNAIMKYSTRQEMEDLKQDILLTDRQRRIFELRYEQGRPIGFIADSMGLCSRVIDTELHTIRKKISKIL